MVTDRSGFHRRIEAILEEMGLRYESEVPDFPPYRLDIYLPEFFAYIEADGPHHTKRADQKRDAYLEDAYKLIGLRLRLKDELKKQEIKERILAFVEKVAPTAERRRRQWQERIISGG